MVRKFNPAEPRDPHSGKWLDTTPGDGGHGLLDFVTDALTGKAALNAAPVSLGKGRFSRGGRGLRKQHVEALELYKSQDYRHVNEDLRKGNLYGTVGAGMVRRIDEVMDRSKLSRDVVLHRRVSDMDMFGSAGRQESLVGLEFREPAYSSATADLDVAKQLYGGTDQRGAILNIRVPTGTGAIQLSDVGPKPQHGGPYPDNAEAELLLQRDLTYRVTGDRTVDGWRYLDVEMVADV